MRWLAGLLVLLLLSAGSSPSNNPIARLAGDTHGLGLVLEGRNRNTRILVWSE